MLTGQLLIGTAMIALTVAIHVLGLAGLVIFFRSRAPHSTSTGYFAITRVLIATVLTFFMLHAVEIWCWAILYMVLGEFRILDTALYFSTVTFTTLGYGDITLQERWRLLSSFEAANGIILFGVSTAFVFAVIERFYRAWSGEK